MKLLRSKPFIKQYFKLSTAIRKKVDRQILHLAQNIRHPALSARKMVGVDEVWEARVDIHYRLTFNIQGDVIVLRHVGTHTIYRKP
jgi:mRNA-degrading endonuclease RelE of RelBE toxin-antitoxin system